MADYEFHQSSSTFDMGAFRVDIFSEYGEVPRAFVVAVANAMMVHSRRGFVGALMRWLLRLETLFGLL